LPGADLAAETPGARPAELPREPDAQLATLASSAPTGDEWIHELKFDGFRILARVENGAVELWSRNHKDWTERFPRVAQALAPLPVTAALVDGEVVVQLPDGRTSFQALQNLGAGTRGELLYYAFDLLHLDGVDLSGAPQEARKELLQTLIGTLPDGPVRFSDHVVGHGPEFLAQACGALVEGIISKRRTAPYRPGRSREWLKVKCLQEQEFVIAGYTDPSGSRTGLGALVLAVNEGTSLRYAGKVGTGFTGAVLTDLERRLRPLARRDPPVSNPPKGAAGRAIHWVEPVLVAQVTFTEETDEGILRHPSYKGLREDKAAGDVVMERPTSAPVAGSAGGGSAKSKEGSQKRGHSRPTRSPAAPSPPVPPPMQATRRVSTRGKAEFELAGVRLSSPDKVLYPEDGITKQELAEYYAAVAPYILPHLADRPLTLVRCPSGYRGDCFFQKHMDEVESPHVRKVRVKEAKDARDYGTVHDLGGILTVVQLGTLELHTWNSRADKLERPDRITMDIDPDPGIEWEQVVQAAQEIRFVVRELGLESFVKTTGGKGLHVVVPLQRRSDWDEVREFAQGIAALVAAARPDRYTLQLSKARRKGRLLLDYYRNARGATAVEVYSTRARTGAPVSTPITWEELEAGARNADFTIRTLPGRLAAIGDAWEDYSSVKQSLTAAMKKRLGVG
jgi:bifunctional non-homologous end joining protein LigD